MSFVHHERALNGMRRKEGYEPFSEKFSIFRQRKFNNVPLNQLHFQRVACESVYVCISPIINLLRPFSPFQFSPLIRNMCVRTFMRYFSIYFFYPSTI